MKAYLISEGRARGHLVGPSSSFPLPSPPIPLPLPRSLLQSCLSTESASTSAASRATPPVATSRTSLPRPARSSTSASCRASASSSSSRLAYVASLPPSLSRSHSLLRGGSSRGRREIRQQHLLAWPRRWMGDGGWTRSSRRGGSAGCFCLAARPPRMPTLRALADHLDLRSLRSLTGRRGGCRHPLGP